MQLVLSVHKMGDIRKVFFFIEEHTGVPMKGNGVLTFTKKEWDFLHPLLLQKDWRVACEKMQTAVRELIVQQFDSDGVCLHCGYDEEEGHDEQCDIVDVESAVIVLQQVMNKKQVEIREQ